MTMNQSSTLVGVFRDRAAAEEAMHELNNAGFTHDQIRYAGPGSTGGFLEDIKSLFTGPGTSSEHLANDLTRMGLSNEEARYYANEYSNGHPIIAMKAPNHEQDALNILNRHGAYNYNMMAAQGKTSGYVPQSPGSPQQAQGYVQQSPDPTQQQPAARPPFDPTQQQPAARPASGYTAPQGTAQANEQPSLQGVATPGRDTELQRLQAQIQETQRQLQDARSQLQAAKDREAQLQTSRQRDSQLETMQRQLQDAQAQLQATLAELYKTQDRLSQANQ